MKKLNQSYLTQIIVFTGLLFGLTYLFAGCFYETNDDVILTFLFQGILYGKPEPDASLYFHGLGFVLSHLYAWFPIIPWYGIFLYSLLFIATVLAFRLIYVSLQNKLSPLLIYLILTGFYLVNWYEHIFWTNYSRIPILLSAVVILNSTYDIIISGTKGRWLGWGYSILYLLALAIRPSLAVYGTLLVLPILFNQILKTRPTKKTLFAFFNPLFLITLFFFTYLNLKTTKIQQEYQRLDLLKSGIVDYEWCCFPDNNQVDNLIYTAITHWYLADTKVIHFLKSHTQPDWNYFWQEAAPNKLIQVTKYLLYDQSIALLAGLLMLVAHNRKYLIQEKSFLGFYNLFFWTLLFLTGILFKIPPRILTPSISIYFLVQVILLKNVPASFKFYPLVAITIFFLLSLQVYKIANRITWQNNRQNQSESVIANVQDFSDGKILLAAGLADELRALSPFKNYQFKTRQVIFLTGWQTLDPSFFNFLQKLTGTQTLPEALSSIQNKNQVVWISTPAFTQFYKNYYKSVYKKNIEFTYLKPVSRINSNVTLHYYKTIIY